MISTDEDIKFLYLLSGSSDVLPPSCLKLRSYLNIHLSNLADQQNLQLLKSFRNRNKTCPYCYTLRSGDTTSFTLLPAQRFRKNRSHKSEEGNTETPEVNQSRNTLVLKCKVCNKKSSFSLVKKKFVEEKVREGTVETVKKKKKKRDKSCGLAINLIENDCKSVANAVIRRKKRVEDLEKVSPLNPAGFQGINSTSRDQSKVIQKHTSIPKNVGGSTSKNLILNPFASQNQQGRKNNKQLERLKQAVKEEKSVAKKTLKDFLTLV